MIKGWILHTDVAAAAVGRKGGSRIDTVAEQAVARGALAVRRAWQNARLCGRIKPFDTKLCGYLAGGTGAVQEEESPAAISTMKNAVNKSTGSIPVRFFCLTAIGYTSKEGIK